MASEQSVEQRGAIRIHPLTELAQFERCVELQLAVWGYSKSDVIPRRIFTVASRIGGQVLGAFAGDVLAGFLMSLPGYRERRPYLHSHMLAVLPEYRNAGLGRRLKFVQREEALARGIELIEWTFDPLEIKNAYFNIVRLGAIARRYQPDFYGPSTSPLQGGLPTDRLYAEWWLRSVRVATAVGNNAAELSESAPVIEQVCIPAAIYEWKRDAAQGKLAVAAQLRVRQALQSAFADGLAITGYERDPDGGGRFLLTRSPAIEVAG